MAPYSSNHNSGTATTSPMLITKEVLTHAFQDAITANLIQFSFDENNYTVSYREPQDSSGKTSKWKFLCSGYYSYFSQKEVQRVTLMLADKLRSVSQDVNDLLLNSSSKPQPTMSIISTVKKLALKATDPDESALREAGIHDDCGELTQDGKALLVEILHKNYKAKLVEVAKQLIENKTV